VVQPPAKLMAVRHQMRCLAALAMVLSAGACNSSETIEFVAGSEVQSSTTCQLAAGGCRATRTGLPIPTYAAEPLVMKSSFVWFDNMGNVTVVNTFRGFDNMLGNRSQVWVNFSQELECVRAIDNLTVRSIMDFNVSIAKSSTSSSAWVEPEEIPLPKSLPCIVQGEGPYSFLAHFGRADSSGTYPLQGQWQFGDELPWILSRPSRAVMRTPHATHEYDWASQSILRKISTGPTPDSLELEILPPASSDRDTTWKICLYPGDGFNYYKEVCTAEFPVKLRSTDCEHTSDARSFHLSSFSVRFLLVVRLLLAAMS